MKFRIIRYGGKHALDCYPFSTENEHTGAFPGSEGHRRRTEKGPIALGKNTRLKENGLMGLKSLKNKVLRHKLPELQFSSS